METINTFGLPFYGKGGKIHIKKENRGKFTAAAKRAGKSVQAYASQILANKERYSPTLVKRANFARNAAKFKHEAGGIVTPYGQWEYPGQVTIIPSNEITMEGVNYPVVGVSNTGERKLMIPGFNYQFNGDYVTEYPLKALEGSFVPLPTVDNKITDYSSAMAKGMFEGNNIADIVGTTLGAASTLASSIGGAVRAKKQGNTETTEISDATGTTTESSTGNVSNIGTLQNPLETTMRNATGVDNLKNSLVNKIQATNSELGIMGSKLAVHEIKPITQQQGGNPSTTAIIEGGEIVEYPDGTLLLDTGRKHEYSGDQTYRPDGRIDGDKVQFTGIPYKDLMINPHLKIVKKGKNVMRKGQPFVWPSTVNQLGYVNTKVGDYFPEAHQENEINFAQFGGLMQQPFKKPARIKKKQQGSEFKITYDPRERFLLPTIIPSDNTRLAVPSAREIEVRNQIAQTNAIKQQIADKDAQTRGYNSAAEEKAVLAYNEATQGTVSTATEKPQGQYYVDKSPITGSYMGDALTAGLALQGIFNPVGTAGMVIGGTLGGKSIDYIIRKASNNKFSGWGNAVGTLLRTDPKYDAAWDWTNPGYFIGGKYGLKIGNYLNNWRLTVPKDINRYYRIVGEAGDPIGDANRTGVIRGPGLNEGAFEAMRQANNDMGKIILTKAHDYPMFSKGEPWRGSTAQTKTDLKKRPIIIRSKENTGPIVWEESNKDFRHKGHNGIFRPSYYGDVNASPTRFFEYWKPQIIGYKRFDFSPNSNSWSNLMGITAENAASITPDQWTAAQDAAIARGDMVEAQRLRDLHFEVSAPDTKIITESGTPLKTYHTSHNRFNSFKQSLDNEYGGFGVGNYFSKDIVNRGPIKYETYLNSTNPYIAKYKQDLPTTDGKSVRFDNINNDYLVRNHSGVFGLDGHEITIYDPKNIKLADAVTYDDNGVRIPLGERDNFRMNDIRYSLIPFTMVGASAALLSSCNTKKDKEKISEELASGNDSVMSLNNQLSYIHLSENPNNKGFNEKNNRYYAYDSYEDKGKTKDIGDGLKLTKSANPEIYDDYKKQIDDNGRHYITKEQHDNAIKERIARDYVKSMKTYNQEMKKVHNIKNAWDSLNYKERALLMDYEYNSKGGLSGFPKLMNAVYNKDIDGIKREYKRYLVKKNGEKLELTERNNITLNRINNLYSEE